MSLCRAVRWIVVLGLVFAKRVPFGVCGRGFPPRRNHFLRFFVGYANARAPGDHRREQRESITGQLAAGSLWRPIRRNIQRLAKALDENIKRAPFECILVTNPKSDELTV